MEGIWVLAGVDIDDQSEPVSFRLLTMIGRTVLMDHSVQDEQSHSRG
jgi:hypothetical protein